MTNLKRMIGLSAIAVAGVLLLQGCIIVDHEVSRGDDPIYWQHHSYGTTANLGADAELALRLRDRLDTDPLARTANLGVEVHDGTVILHGSAPDMKSYERSLQIISATDGVGDVVSRVRIKSP